MGPSFELSATATVAEPLVEAAVEAPPALVVPLDPPPRQAWTGAVYGCLRLCSTDPSLVVVAAWSPGAGSRPVSPQVSSCCQVGGTREAPTPDEPDGKGATKVLEPTRKPIAVAWSSVTAELSPACSLPPW